MRAASESRSGRNAPNRAYATARAAPPAPKMTMDAPDKVNLAAKLGKVDAHWVPTIVGELNGQYVKVVKFLGEYVWHSHEHEDEAFMVLSGEARVIYDTDPETIAEEADKHRRKGAQAKEALT